MKKKRKKVQPKTGPAMPPPPAFKVDREKAGSVLVNWVEVGPTRTEWQVVFQDGTRHVFYSERDVRLHLTALIADFATHWDPSRTSELRLNVMRVERHHVRDDASAFALAK